MMARRQTLVLISILLLWCSYKEVESSGECFQCTNNPDNLYGWNATDKCLDEKFDAKSLKLCVGPSFCYSEEIVQTLAGGVEIELVTRDCAFSLPYEGCQSTTHGDTTITLCYCVGDECNEAHKHGVEDNCIACKSQDYIFGVEGANLATALCEDANLPEGKPEQKALGGCYSGSQTCGKIYTKSTYGMKVYQRFCAKEAPHDGCITEDSGNVETTTCYCKEGFCNTASPMATASLLGLLVACVTTSLYWLH